MTSYFDDMTMKDVNLTKMRKSGVNGGAKTRGYNRSEGGRLLRLRPPPSPPNHAPIDLARQNDRRRRPLNALQRADLIEQVIEPVRRIRA